MAQRTQMNHPFVDPDQSETSFWLEPPTTKKLKNICITLSYLFYNIYVGVNGGGTTRSDLQIVWYSRRQLRAWFEQIEIL